MCGIAGYFSADRREAGGERLLREMVLRLRHRGPDGDGFYADPVAGLGHARLSIVGVSNGGQPLTGEDGSVQVIFNGEIFNHRELRSMLEAKGHRFKTLSDGEVLVHGYEEEGMAFLERLNGQFAYALYDRARERIYLVRDRLGILPIFYTEAGGTLYFGSEAKALFAVPGIRAELDRDALAQIFTLWTPVPPRTIFKNVRQVQPGTYLAADRSGLRETRYWDLDFSARLTGHEGREAERFEELFLDAVRIRLQADVPVGIYLSGGVDSSAAAAASIETSGSLPETFSIRFDDARYDEAEEQMIVARHLGLSNRSTVFREAELEAALPQSVYHAESPALRTAFAPLWGLSRLTHASGYKAVIGGEGADEILLGYDLFKEAKIRAFRARQPASAGRAKLFGRIYPFLQDGAASGSFLTQALSKNFENTADPFYAHRVRWESTARTHRFFSDAFRDTICKADPLEELERSMPAGFKKWDPVARAQTVEIRLFLSNYLLSTQGDRMAMAHSIEVRYPFLDHRLVEFMNALPVHKKMPGLKEKVILKRAFRRRLPERILDRHKHPYRAPGKLLRVLADRTSGLGRFVSPEAIRQHQIFDPVRTDALIGKAAAAGGDLSESDQMALAGILTTQIFCHHFF